MKQTILIAVLTMFLIASCTDNKPTAQEPAPIDTIPMMVSGVSWICAAISSKYIVPTAPYRNEMP